MRQPVRAEAAYRAGVIIGASSTAKARVRMDDDGTEENMPLDDLFPANARERDDVTALPHLSEASVLANVRERRRPHILPCRPRPAAPDPTLAPPRAGSSTIT